MALYTTIVLALQATVFIANLFLAWLVIYNNPRSRSNMLFGIYAVSLAMWNISLFLTITGIGGPTPQLWWSRLAFSFYLLMLNSFLYFAVTYPQNRRVSRVVDFIFWALTVGLFYLTLTPYLVAGDIKIITGFITGRLGPLMAYFSWYYPALILLSIIVLMVKILRTKGIIRTRLFYIFLGFTVFAVPMIITNIILPIFYGSFRYNNLGPLFSFPMLAIINYAIVRHHLMDVDVIIRRGTVFTLLFGVMITLLTASTGFLSSFLSPVASQLLTAFLLTVMFVPTKKTLEHLTDTIFFRKAYQIDEALTNLNHILIRTSNLDHLAKNILNHFGQTLKITKAMMLIAESQEDFQVRSAYGEASQLKKLDNRSRLIRYLQSFPLLHEAHEKEILTIHDLEQEVPTSSEVKKVAQEQWELVIQEVIRLGFVLVMPIYAKRKLIGIIFLGAKKSGDYFSSQDMKFLDLASHEIAFSVENGLNIERLMRVDEVKSEFITVVSHQLRTPLSVSRWNFELLLSGAFGEIPKKIREIIEGTHIAMMDLNQGVNNLMTALEIEEGKVVTHFEESNINDVIDEALSGVKQELEAKDIEVDRDFGTYSGVLNIDRHKIQRVLEILLDNAIRYSQPKSKIAIKTEFNPDPERELKVTIEDFGIGIDSKNLEIIFQKFFRGEQAKKASPGGFGLGLFISKAYIELHGGKIGIQPKEGSGTIMYFTLPIRHMAASEKHSLPAS